MKRDRTSVNVDEAPLIETPQKVMLLMQGYLRDVTYENFSLINDTQYVIQNSIRLLRCLLDLCSKKNQAENVMTILNWCKFIENRIYRDDSPLKQFTKFSFSGYNAMKLRKQFEGFLSMNIYERFE
jgi:activating signal cointegrator complex subunit 3